MSLSLFCPGSRGESFLFLWRWEKREAAFLLVFPHLAATDDCLSTTPETRRRLNRDLGYILLCFSHHGRFVSSRMFAGGWFSDQNWIKNSVSLERVYQLQNYFSLLVFYKFNNFVFGFINARKVWQSVLIEPLPNNVIQSRCFGNMGLSPPFAPPHWRK